MAKVRILHVQDHTVPKFSGYAFRSRYLVEAEHRLGLESEVVSSARHREFGAPVEEIEGLRIHRTPWPSSPLARLELRVPFWRERVLVEALARRIVEAARGFRPDLLHAHSPIFDGLAARRAARALGIPFVYQIRAFWEDDAVDKGKIREGGFVYRQVRRIETSLCRRAAQVVVICEGLKGDVAGRGIPPERITVVPNGVDVERFQSRPADAALRKELGLEGCEVAAFIGSFFHYEGLPLLVEALALLKERRPRLRVLFVGGGEDEERTRARARELGVLDRAVFAGRVPHERVAACYALADVLVYPRISRRITELVTPLKPLEAWAMGKPVIGSDVGGIRELFEEIGAGLQFPAGSAPGLAAALAAVLDRPEALRRSDGERAREALAAKRRWTDLAARLLPVYEALAGRPSAPLSASAPGIR